jgi:hypothetical protein
VPVRSAPRLQWIKTGPAEHSSKRNIYVAHSRVLDSLFFSGRAAIRFPKIDDRLDSQFGQVLKPGIGWLRTPVDAVIHLVEIFHASNLRG